MSAASTLPTSPGTGAPAHHDASAPETPGPTEIPAAPVDVAPAEAHPAVGPLEIGQKFGRYHIIRLLGMGGMGAVYQAWDSTLDVAVALKVVRPEVTANHIVVGESERRFKRELLLARQVTHKNVVRIHDLGEIASIKYITMAYVEGLDLATILKREGKLPVSQALRIVRGIVSGLRAAHDAGVVHRDLKPANIMIEAESGEPLIMDFGIARPAAVSTNAAEQGSRDTVRRRLRPALAGATTAGAVVGTLSYMAPEQAKGQAVDQRADVYALGLIFYDMLTGAGRVERAASEITELQERMEHPPSPVRSVEPLVPDSLDRLIHRCLQPDRDARYRTAAEVAAALDALDAEGRPLPRVRRLTARLMSLTALAVAGLVTATWWFARAPTAPVQKEPMSVLITDFDNQTNDPVFEGAVEQALAIAIEDASFITSYPRDRARQLAAEIRPGSRLDEASARLVSVREGIKVILAGSIASKGSGFAIAVKAIDPADGKVLTTETTSARRKTDVLAGVASCAAAIRGALGDEKPESARLAAAETFTAASLEAMRAYVRGQDLAAAGRYQEAIQAYEEALSHDSKFGRAYISMGAIYKNLKEDQKAEGLYQQGLKLLDRMTERERYRTLGVYYLSVARNHEKAIENYETLVRLYPADNIGYGNLALAYLWAANVPQAVTAGRKAVEVSPRNLMQRTNYAMYSMYAGEFDTAIRETRRVLQENPTYEFAFLPLALASLSKGDVQAARETFDRLAKVSALGYSLANMGEADAEMYYGRFRKAAGILESGMAADRRAGSSGNLAHKYVALAETLLASGAQDAAADMAGKALTLSRHEAVLFSAARVFVEAGQEEPARRVARDLQNMLQQQTRSYASLITGQLALSRGELSGALDAFQEAVKRHDSWFARFLLGRGYLEAGHFAEALAEFELCLKRRGEAADVFFVDTPTLRYLPPVYYWLARAQQELGAMAAARVNYEQFLKLRGDADPPDPLAADAASRLSGS
ncbi:MAG: protein kinase [Acidobacteria bacterium]|nr:protein kinase [Acidobacteriota bacterium]